MYQLIVLCTLFINALGERCVTPARQKGVCIPIRSCPSLLWSFANPKNGAIEGLKKFVCSENDDTQLKVCCPQWESFLAFENDDDEGGGQQYLAHLANTKDCGTVKYMQGNNGTIRLQDFPWLVKLVATKTDDSGQQTKAVSCTGVLINQRYVLYSARCYYMLLRGYPFHVRIDNPISPDAVDHCQTTSYASNCINFDLYRPETFTIHPFYDPQTNLNDIAVLLLHANVGLSDHMQPICLPTATTGHLDVGDTLYTAGWRRTYDTNEISMKHARTSTYISNDECRKTNSVTSYEICTSTDQKLDEDHDLGLPLMTLHNNRWYLHGFETYGETTRIHTRVQNYLQWIEEMTSETRCLTPHGELGECSHLTDCPRLMDAFANSLPEDEEALAKFICQYPNEIPENTEYALKVCCGVQSNFTIIPESADKDLNFDISNFKFCGFQHRDDYFSNNDEISVDEFPWLAVILNATLPGQRDVICGGTLITERHVLTSTQCLLHFNPDDTALVRLGDYNRNNSSQCSYAGENLYDCTEVQEYDIVGGHFHRFYNPFAFLNDIAILRLNRTVIFSDYVRPICLPRSEDDVGKIGETVFATGFGRRTNESITIKKKIRTMLVSIEICKEDEKRLGFLQPITKYQLCTRDFLNSTDAACRGDEGGPVMFSRKFQWFLEGISSTYACGSDKSKNHLRIYKYLKWIKLRIEK